MNADKKPGGLGRRSYWNRGVQFHDDVTAGAAPGRTGLVSVIGGQKAERERIAPSTMSPGRNMRLHVASQHGVNSRLIPFCLRSHSSRSESRRVVIVSFALGMTTRALFRSPDLSVVRRDRSRSPAGLDDRSGTSAASNRYPPWRMLFQYASLSCRSALQAEMIRRSLCDTSV